MPWTIAGFLIGVIWLQWQPTLPPWGFFIMAGVSVLLLSGPLRGIRPGLWLLAGALLGSGYAAWRAENRLADVRPSAFEGRDLQVTGRVDGLVRQHARAVRFTLADVRFSPALDGAKAHLPRRISLSWYETAGAPLPQMLPGSRWALTVRLKRPHRTQNPHVTDGEGRLLAEGITATGYVRLRPPPVQLEESSLLPGDRVNRWRQHLRQRLEKALPQSPMMPLLAALTIGDQQSITTAQWTTLRQTGTTHLMAISGLHLSLVAGLAAWLAASIWRRWSWGVRRLPSQHAALVAGAMAALGYAALAGWGLPVQRALLMLLVAGFAIFSGRFVRASYILLIAAAVVVLVDPWAVLLPGFWLSFVAVACLLLVARRKGLRFITAQWAVTLGLAPWLLLLFGQWSWISPLANLPAIPVVGFLVTPLALLGSIIPLDIIWEAAAAILSATMTGLDWLAAAAGPGLALPGRPWFLWALAAMGSLFCLLPVALHAWPLGIVMWLPLLLWTGPVPETGEAWITVLDVGQGQAVVIRTASSVTLIDSGPGFDAEANAGRWQVLPFLKGEGVERLDTLIVTHRDTDHAGGVASVLDEMPVDRVLASFAGAPLPASAEACRAGQSWLHDGVRFGVLHPDATAYRNRNDGSCVLLIETGQHRLLVASDIERGGERALLARYGAELASDVLIVPHHGSLTSSTLPFVKAVSPQTAIVSAGYRNRYRHPRDEVVQRYQALGASVRRTDQDGALRIVLSPHEVKVTAWRAIRRRYWHAPAVADIVTRDATRQGE